jgi:hypothetical protein
MGQWQTVSQRQENSALARVRPGNTGEEKLSGLSVRATGLVSGDGIRPQAPGLAGSQRRTQPPVPACPLLATVIAAWPSLPEAVKSALVSVVSAHAPAAS